MADISKIKLANGTTVDIKDATGRSNMSTLLGSHELEALKAAAWKDVETTLTDDANLPTGAAVTDAIEAEAALREAADDALDTRVSNLEARGRFLSAYSSASGEPTTYPTVPTGQTSYTYTFKSGDYYIVGEVAASGATKYMPSGSSISTTDGGTTWTVGKAETTNEIGLGDYFLYDGTKWVWVQNSTKTITFSQITGQPDDNANLKSALDALRNGKVSDIATGTTNGTIKYKKASDGTYTEVAVAGLEDLAYSDTASGSTTYTPAGTLGALDVTPAGSVTINDLTQTATAATLTKGDFTPAGSITGSAISGGSIAVTVKDATEATAVTNLEYENYTPAGTIAATAAGSFSALKSATFGEDSTNGVQIEGTISKPAITVNDDTTDTFVKSLKAGTVDAASVDTTKFSGGSFTGATAASFTQGAKASFTQGTKASFDKGTAVAAATEGIVATVGTGDDAETLIFTAAATDNVIGHDEATFTPNGTDSFTANGDDNFTANNVGTFTAAAINDGFFSAEKLPVVDGTAAAVTAVSAELAEAPAFTGKKYKVATTDDTALKEVAFTGTAAAVKLTGAKYLKQEINTATFTPEAATLGFSGTKAENVLVTGVSYDKATANGGSFSGTSKSVTPVFTGTEDTISVTVSPD